MPADLHDHPLCLRGRVLPGDDLRDVFVVAGRLTFTEPDEALTLLDGGWLASGLADAHAHLSLPDDQRPPADRDRHDHGHDQRRHTASPDQPI